MDFKTVRSFMATPVTESGRLGPIVPGQGTVSSVPRRPISWIEANL